MEIGYCRTLGIIKFNIYLSLALKAVFIVLALSGLATLWMAVAADMGASLIVVANGLRALHAPNSGRTDAADGTSVTPGR